MSSSLTVAAIVLCVVFFTTGQGQSTNCSIDAFSETCLQRRAFRRSQGSANIALCRKERDFTGSIVLINVSISDSTDTVFKVESNVQPDERNNTCLLEQLRPQFTGYTSRSTVPIDYRACGVGSTGGFLILVYTCIIKEDTSPTIQLPQCSGFFNGSKIRLETIGFPNVGWNNTGNDCNCTVNTGANSIDVTTYYMKLTHLQSVTIADSTGVGLYTTNTSMDPAMVRNTLSVNGSLFLTWQNMENAIVDSSKLWIEMEVNDTVLSVRCDQKQATTTTTTTVKQATTGVSTQVTNTETTSGNVTTKGQTIKQSGSSTLTPTNDSTDGSGLLLHSSSTLPSSISNTPRGSTISNHGASPKTGASSTDNKDDGSSFTIIAVLIPIGVIIVIAIVVVLVCKKKNNNNGTVAPGNTQHGADQGETPAEKIKPEEINPQAEQPQEQPIVNTSLDVTRLPPINGSHQGQSVINNNAEQKNGMSQEDVEEKKKKKKKKKKRNRDTQDDFDHEENEKAKKKSNKVHPEPNQQYNSEQAISEESDGDEPLLDHEHLIN